MDVSWMPEKMRKRLANKGLGNWEIAKELEIHKSTVSRYVQLGKDKGTIKR